MILEGSQQNGGKIDGRDEPANYPQVQGLWEVLHELEAPATSLGG